MKCILLMATLIVSIATTAQLSFSSISDPLLSDGASKNGASWIDYDLDGDMDLFLSQSSGPNYFYENDGAGNLTLTSSAMTGSLNYPSMGSTWGDMDNDGDLDVFMACRYANNRLYRNDGGFFSEVTTGDIVNDGGASNNAAFVDYDNDGYLDVYVINRDDEVNFLYKGNGDGTFVKITSGDIVSDADHFTTDVWADVDRDGHIDVFVANHDLANFLYKNNGDGTFTGITTGSIVTDIGTSRTASWGDYDNDGDFDLFVGNGLNESDVIYENTGGFTFTAHPLGDSKSANASAWADFDNDGWLDLYVGNIGDTDDLYINSGSGGPSFISSPMGGSTGSADGIAVSDFDSDGDVDIYVPNWFTNDAIYQNDLMGQNRYIHFRLEGTVSNRSAIGAIVETRHSDTAGHVWQSRQVEAQSGRHAQSDLTVEFGFGNTAIIDSVYFYWPSGQVCSLANVITNQIVDISEDCAIVDTTSTSISEIGYGNIEMLIHPNPVSELLQLEIPGGLKENALLNLNSANGQLVYEQPIEKGLQKFSIPVADFAKGTYILSISSASGKGSKLLQIE